MDNLLTNLKINILRRKMRNKKTDKAALAMMQERLRSLEDSLRQDVVPLGDTFYPLGWENDPNHVMNQKG